jgi:hypothetical protein
MSLDTPSLVPREVGATTAAAIGVRVTVVHPECRRGYLQGYPGR